MPSRASRAALKRHPAAYTTFGPGCGGRALSIGSAGGGGGASTFNFNGGAGQAIASRTNFFQGFTTANVRKGGAVIDTNGYDVTVAQNLLHDTTKGAMATDGGLTKNGAGILTLSGANTYTGRTIVGAGTLEISANGGLGKGDVVLSSATVLELDAGVAAAHNASTGTTLTLASATMSIVSLAGTGVQDTVASLVINGVTEPVGTYGAIGSGAAHTGFVNFTGTGELSVVPEPSAWTAVGVALALGLTVHQLRRSAA